jgi:ribosome-associated toxin RatA of RatAB toxin-antitoxin module
MGMSDYQHSVEIMAPAQSVYEFVSDPEHLPEFLPTLKEAHATHGDQIELKASVAGHEYATTGELHLDPDEREMHWGSEEGSYRGQLKVTGDDNGCKLSVRLDFKTGEETEEKIKERSPDEKQTIQDALVDSLETVKRLCESTVHANREDHGYLG